MAAATLPDDVLRAVAAFAAAREWHRWVGVARRWRRALCDEGGPGDARRFRLGRPLAPGWDGDVGGDPAPPWLAPLAEAVACGAGPGPRDCVLHVPPPRGGRPRGGGAPPPAPGAPPVAPGLASAHVQAYVHACLDTLARRADADAGGLRTLVVSLAHAPACPWRSVLGGSGVALRAAALLTAGPVGAGVRDVALVLGPAWPVFPVALSAWCAAATGAPRARVAVAVRLHAGGLGAGVGRWAADPAAGPNPWRPLVEWVRGGAAAGARLCVDGGDGPTLGALAAACAAAAAAPAGAAPPRLAALRLGGGGPPGAAGGAARAWLDGGLGWLCAAATDELDWGCRAAARGDDDGAGAGGAVDGRPPRRRLCLRLADTGSDAAGVVALWRALGPADEVVLDVAAGNEAVAADAGAWDRLAAHAVAGGGARRSLVVVRGGASASAAAPWVARLRAAGRTVAWRDPPG